MWKSSDLSYAPQSVHEVSEDKPWKPVVLLSPAVSGGGGVVGDDILVRSKGGCTGSAPTVCVHTAGSPTFSQLSSPRTFTSPTASPSPSSSPSNKQPRELWKLVDIHGCLSAGLIKGGPSRGLPPTPPKMTTPPTSPPSGRSNASSPLFGMSSPQARLTPPTSPSTPGGASPLNTPAGYAYRAALVAAEAGNVDAALFVGNCRRYGRGVRLCANEAFAWYKFGAEGGNVPAKTALAGAYMRGEGVPRDPTIAAKLYKGAAEGGCVEAMFIYHTCLRQGTGVVINPSEALRWLSRAVDAGHTGARAALCEWTWPPAAHLRAFAKVEMSAALGRTANSTARAATAGAVVDAKAAAAAEAADISRIRSECLEIFLANETKARAMERE